MRRDAAVPLPNQRTTAVSSVTEEGAVDAAAAEPNVVESLRTGVVLVDALERVSGMNAAAEQLLGIGRRVALGRAMDDLLPHAQPLVDLVRRALATGGGYAHRALALHAPGALHTATCDVEATPLGAGSERRVLVELRDAEPGLRYGRELVLSAQLDASRSLARQLGHEIRNPLGGLRGAAQLLARRLDGPELHEYVQVILREADRLAGLVDRMLGPAGAPRRQCVNIHDPLQHVERLLAAEYSASLVFVEDFDPSIPAVTADRDELVQALLNIVRNAAQAVEGAGRIRLRTRVATQLSIAGRPCPLAVRVEVEDDGPGVPDAIRDTLFYPLVTGRRDGTGLGLALAQDLVRRQQGVIEYASRPGCTVFTVLLPVERA
jgi:two-component system nitrogen regulation sensor histidine kinase GlnL